jgi:hypothetical protein
MVPSITALCPTLPQQAYAVNTNFQGADMTNAVVDRVVFDGANLRGVKFINTVVTGATFEGADLTDSVWEEVGVALGCQSSFGRGHEGWCLMLCMCVGWACEGSTG